MKECVDVAGLKTRQTLHHLYTYSHTNDQIILTYCFESFSLFLLLCGRKERAPPSQCALMYTYILFCQWALAEVMLEMDSEVLSGQPQ